MSNLNHETVLSVHHWTDTLFSFTTTRDPAFRFENGQFAMIGLEIDGKPLLRAYSMVSPNLTSIRSIARWIRPNCPTSGTTPIPKSRRSSKRSSGWCIEPTTRAAPGPTALPEPIFW